MARAPQRIAGRGNFTFCHGKPPSPSFRGARRVTPESIGPQGYLERWIPGSRWREPRNDELTMDAAACG